MARRRRRRRSGPRLPHWVTVTPRAVEAHAYCARCKRLLTVGEKAVRVPDQLGRLRGYYGEYCGHLAEVLDELAREHDIRIGRAIEQQADIEAGARDWA